jgi:amino acid adenylation domain-containing protein
VTLAHALPARAAEAVPGAVAFDDGATVRTYAALAGDAARLATALRASGVATGDRVGVALDGGYEVLVALFGILAAGAAYVPLGARAAPGRLAAIAADAELAALVDGRGPGASAPAPEVRHGARGAALLDPDAARAMSWAEVAECDASGAGPGPRETDLAYILYTSGSTGRPKGVAHDHASLAAFVAWAVGAVVTDASDRVAAATAITFDISLLELVVPAARGATTVGIPRHVTIFPGALTKALDAAAPTVLQLVPSLWRSVMDEPEALRSVRVAVVTGERMAPRDWRALRAALPDARVLNVYGSTEVNDCACFELPESWPEDAGDVPIGTAVSGVTLELDARADGAGDTGELLVASPMLMRGYWNLPEETSRRIVTLPGARRAYRTGDQVRRAPDGALRVEGRIDRAVKLGGEWVDLDEVEAVAARHPNVVEAVAVVNEAAERAAVRLVAVASGDIDGPALQRWCGPRLPRPARPQVVELVEALPRTAHGKPDRARLVAAGPHDHEEMRR